MSHNAKRAAKMALLSRAQLERRVDAATLSSAAASYALLKRFGVVRQAFVERNGLR